MERAQVLARRQTNQRNGWFMRATAISVPCREAGGISLALFLMTRMRRAPPETEHSIFRRDFVTLRPLFHRINLLSPFPFHPRIVLPPTKQNALSIYRGNLALLYPAGRRRGGERVSRDAIFAHTLKQKTMYTPLEIQTCHRGRLVEWKESSPSMEFFYRPSRKSMRPREPGSPFNCHKAIGRAHV